MKLLHPNWTSSLVQFGAASVDCIERNGSIPGAFMLASISKDGTFGWVARGGALEVFTSQNGQRLAGWTFGAALKDTSTIVTAVTEYIYDDSPRLLVGTTSSNTQAGLLCVFDVRTSKVIKALEVPYKITAIEPVTSVGADQAPAQVLSEHLRCFCGVVAVGTHNGHIYMIDLNLDDEGDSSDEVRPNSVLFLDPRVRDVASRRFSAISKRRHLCLELDDESHQRGYFYLRKPDSSVLKTYVADEVCVSSMLYMRQTASLVVGFNMGVFQLWGLYTPVLEYTSRFAEDLSPITHFAYQEPENDPRNFVYIWAGFGPLPIEPVEDQTACMKLFQLGYNKKIWHEGLGYVYEDLQTVGPRFEHYLTTNPYNSEEEDCIGSRIVCCYTIQDPNYTVPERTESEDSFDEGAGGPDLSLCGFVWEAAPPDQQARSEYHLAVFDMNRWYHAQMPSILRYTGQNSQICSFLAFYSLQSVSEACSPYDVMALNISSNSLARYQSCVIPVPEHHLFPSSLAFEAISITENGLVLSRFLGQQRQVVSDMLRGGPGLLVEPAMAYVLCLSAGLLPRTAETTPTATVPVAEKRIAILNVMLDHNQAGFLSACVHAWASGEFAGAGCTLRFLLDWAWSRVGAMKESMDRICVSLYDWSGLPLDATGLTLLHQHQVAIQAISGVLGTMATTSVPSTDQGRSDLDTKVMVVKLIDAHLSMLIWCYTEGFLPEVGEEEALMDNRYGFPHSQLKTYFLQRRQGISRLNSELQGTELLMIDGIVEQAGVTLQELWEKEGGLGVYPPPSLHAVLNMYLLEHVPLPLKHSIFFYLLCDLMYLTPEETTERFEEKMHHFAATFSLPYATIRLVQGFWHLDRKEFEEAMFFLLDPIIRSELLPWQHTRVVKALLYQGHHKMALKYIRIKKPPMVTPEDVKLRLTVLLANGLTAEAFEYQRTCRDQGNMEDLLSHLYLGCQQTKTIDQLLQLPLSGDEEQQLVSHMKSTSEPHSTEVLVLHYLQRSRVIEALKLNSKIKNSTLSDVDTVARERSLARQAIVDCYQRILPRAQRKMAFGTDQALKRGASTRREVTRPAPLSTFVNRAKRSQAVSHATLINTVLEKVREVKEYDISEPQPTTSTAEFSPAADRHPGPFTCTPITPRSRSRIGEKSEVVYPSVHYHEPSPQAAATSAMLSPRRPSPYSTTLHETFQPVNFNTSVRRKSRITSAAALSLLQTPPVRRKTPGSARMSAPNSASTPHSILKVRHSTRTATESPLTGKTTKFSEQAVEINLYRKLNMDLTALASSSAAVSGPVSAPTSALKPHLTATTSTGSAQNTPKQLRFSVPASPESTPSDRSATPSPQPPVVSSSSEGLNTSPMRSVRDRSPTPERYSPKASPKMDVLRTSLRFAQSGDVEMDIEDEKESCEIIEANQFSDDIVMEDMEEDMVVKPEVQLSQGDQPTTSGTSPSTLPVTKLTCHYEEQDENDIEDDQGVKKDIPQTSAAAVIHSHYEEMSTASEGEEEAEEVHSVIDAPTATGGTLYQHYEEQAEEEEKEEDEIAMEDVETEENLPQPHTSKEPGVIITRHYEEQQEADEVVDEKKDSLVKSYYEEQESEPEDLDEVDRDVAKQAGDNAGQASVIMVSNVEISITKSESVLDSNQDNAQLMDTAQASEEQRVAPIDPAKEDQTQDISTKLNTTKTLTKQVSNATTDSSDSQSVSIPSSSSIQSVDLQSVRTSSSSTTLVSSESSSTNVTSTLSVVVHPSLSNVQDSDSESDTEPLTLHLEADEEDLAQDRISSTEVLNGDDLTEELEELPPHDIPVIDNAIDGVSEGDASSVTSSNASSSLSGVTTLSSQQQQQQQQRRPEILKLSTVEPEFKTPPRPTRSTSMPPTPPESGQGTPPQEASPPKGTMTSEQVPVPAPEGRTTRSKTPPRQAKSQDQTTNLETQKEEEAEVEGSTSPPRTRSARAGTPTRATTPPRTTRATTPPRTTRATTPTRTATPTRKTRGTTPPRTIVAEPSTPPQPATPAKGTTPRRSTRATTPQRSTRATTPPRITRSSPARKGAEDDDGSPVPEEAVAPRPRGRPKKNLNASQVLNETEKQEDEEMVTEETPASKQRGRPRKTTLNQSQLNEVNEETEQMKIEEKETAPAPKPRGRPRKNQTLNQTIEIVTEDVDQDERMLAEEPKEVAPKQRGRPRKSLNQTMEAVAQELNTRTTRASRLRADSTSTIEDDKTDTLSVASTSSRRSRGRGSRTPSPVAPQNDILGERTPPRPNGPEDDISSRVTRSGGRSKNTPTRRTPTRRSTRKQTLEVNKDDVETALKAKGAEDNNSSNTGAEGLLSSQSFMMGLRTRRSMSREPTPEPPAAAISETSSAITDEDMAERASFTFSEPMAVDSSKDNASELVVPPVSSFIFSPPLTRTKSRNNKSDPDLKSKVKVKSILPDAPADITKIVNAKKATSGAKKAKSTAAPSDSPINFLSPVDNDTEEDHNEEPKRRVLQKKPMTLRPKRGTTKKKAPLKLW